MESLLHFIFQNNVLLIQLFLLFILVTTAYLAYRTFVFYTNGDSAEGGKEFNQDKLEKMLQQILEKAHHIPSPDTATAQTSTDSLGAELSASAPAGASAGTMTADAQKLLVEIDVLKKELKEKQSYIENVKNQSPAASSGDSGNLSNDEKEKLNTQIKELQGKLSEYEIISEDIADLSFFKEENTKLQRELEALKSQKAAPAAAVVPEKPVEVKAPAEVPAPAAVVAAPAPEAPVPAAPEAPAPTAAPAEVASAELPTEAALGIDQDLMKEFEDAVDSTTPEEVDLDKVMMEATQLPEASTSEPVVDSINEIDELKLEEEAKKLATSTSEAKSDDKEVMDQFQNFVKKG